MSNLAGKAFAMNLVTPLKQWRVTGHKIVFWALTPSTLQRFVSRLLKLITFGKLDLSTKLNGLITLSMIHYARWVIVRPEEWPHLGHNQPREDLHYAYQLFFSNFNGTWAQYVDSFSAAIPAGLDMLWRKNVGWPKSVPQEPFHRYVEHNEVWTDYYYSAYPMAASNDIKAAQRLRRELLEFIETTKDLEADEFERRYDKFLNSLQGNPSPDASKPDNFPCLGQMGPTPIVSLASVARMSSTLEDYQYNSEARHAK